MDQMNYEAVQEVDAVLAVEEVKEVQEVKPYTLGRLKPDNIFTCVTILSKIGFKEIRASLSPDSLQAIVEAAKAEGDTKNIVEKAGLGLAMDIAGVICTNLESCKGNIYQLLADLSGMTTAQIQDLDAAVFIEMIVDVFRQDGFKDFFKAVLKFFK